MTDRLEFVIDGTAYGATLLADEAPRTVEALLDILPLDSQLQHVRWSGYAVWINIDDVRLPDLPRENHTVYPSRGDVLLYPGYRNEQEILLSCGPTCFRSPAGDIAGNHVAILDASREQLAAFEARTIEEGTQRVSVRTA